MSSKQVSALEGLEQQFGGKAEIRYALGATYGERSLGSLTADVLTPPDGSGHGLLAEYFEGASFEGEPKLQREVPRPYTVQGFRSSLPDAEVAAVFGEKSYSVRWTGALRAPFTGEYVVGPSGSRFGQPTMRIFLDDEELVPTTPSAPPARGRGFRFVRREPARVQLEAGRTYQLRVEYTPPQRGSDDGFGTEMRWAPPAQPLLEEAVAVVKDADVTLAFLGMSPSLEGEGGGPFRHRPARAPGETARSRRRHRQARGRGLERRGSALAINYAAEHAAAIMATWYGGEEIGTAIAETLAGANNPAGRLPITFYKSLDQLPPFEDYNMKGHTYRYFEGEPLYGFGYGLSYSKFEYSDLRAQRTGDGATVIAPGQERIFGGR